MPAQITAVDGGDRSFVPETKTGRLWTYVRDDRPASDSAAPAVWFANSPDRKGEHPTQHLEKFRGNGEKRQMARA